MENIRMETLSDGNAYYFILKKLSRTVWCQMHFAKYRIKNASNSQYTTLIKVHVKRNFKSPAEYANKITG